MLVDLAVDAVVYWKWASINVTECSTCQHTDLASCSNWVRTSLQQSKDLAKPEYAPSGATMLFGDP
jgi:hypothetical protein